MRPMQQRWDGWLTKVEAEIPARRAEREEAVSARRAQSDAAAQARASQTQSYQAPLPPQVPQAPLSGQVPLSGLATQAATQPATQPAPGIGEHIAQGGQSPTVGLPAQLAGQHQHGQHQYGGRAPQHSAPSQLPAWQQGADPHGGQHAGHTGIDPQGWQPGPDPGRWPGSDPQDPARPGEQQPPQN